MSRVVGQEQAAAAGTQIPHLPIEGHHVPGPGPHGMIRQGEAPGRVRRSSSAPAVGAHGHPRRLDPVWPALWAVSLWAASLVIRRDKD